MRFTGFEQGCPHLILRYCCSADWLTGGAFHRFLTRSAVGATHVRSDNADARVCVETHNTDRPVLWIFNSLLRWKFAC
jgi:hypothetical protein